MKSPELVVASEIKEFFYEDSNSPVEEGDPVGIDLENGDNVDFLLLDNIYWSPLNEEGYR